MIFCPIEDF
jgi:hypothetical protein